MSWRWNRWPCRACCRAGSGSRPRTPAGAEEFQTDGTLGCLAGTVDQPANQPPNVLLSNHHVLFNVHEETHQVNGAVGDEVRLPSCSGCCEPLIGKVLRGDQKLDAAIATLTPGQKLHARIHDIPVTGTLDITPGQWAQAAGRDDAATQGGRAAGT